MEIELDSHYWVVFRVRPKRPNARYAYDRIDRAGVIGHMSPLIHFEGFEGTWSPDVFWTRREARKRAKLLASHDQYHRYVVRKARMELSA